MTKISKTITAPELDALLAVARKHKVSQLTIEGVVAAHIEYLDESMSEATSAVVNAGGWKRRPDLDQE